MTTTARFISHLKSLGIKLWLDSHDREKLRFQARKGVFTKALRAEIIERKAEILSFLSQAQQTTLPLVAIQPATRDSVLAGLALPLSFSQERLWFLDQIEENSVTYNVPALLRLLGPLNVSALEWSLSEIERRHEALRTTFPQINGQAQQQIGPPTFRLSQVAFDTAQTEDRPSPLAPLPTLGEGNQEAELERLALTYASQPFDLAEGPLWRATLLRLGENHHALLLTFHHIICDLWSMGVFNRELNVFYESYLNGQLSPLPALELQYADFAVWQRGELVKNQLEQQLSYWKSQLAGIPARLNLPTDHARPAVQSYRGADHVFALPIALTQQLKQLSQKSGVTLFMTLQAALALLFFRYTGQEDILIGTPVANRQRAELEPLIGFFVNTLVLRNDLSQGSQAGKPTFSQFLTRVRQMALDAYRHQDVPFELLVEALQPERSLSHNPLFQVMFSLEEMSQEQVVKLPGLTVEFVTKELPVAKFDLSLTLQDKEKGLSGAWEYSTDLFEQATIERMTAHFQTLLAGIVSHPEQPIDELPLLTAAERHQLLVEWNQTAVDYPTDQCIHHLFEQQAERTPDAIALVFKDKDKEEQLTYHELNCRANQLAHYLIKRGIGPDMLVGICMERSLEMVIGLLGILKAGGAYVPFDPHYPQERLTFMLEDAQVKLIVTQASLHLPIFRKQTLLELDSDWQLYEESQENPEVIVSPTNLAYVIYTSGSTGQPKGVMITHQAIYNQMSWIQNTFAFTPSDKVLQKTPFSFDASVWEFYAPLLVGGQLVIAPSFSHQDSSYMVQIIQSKKITILQVVPTQLRMLLEVGGLEQCHSLKHLFCGGEALPVELVKRFKSLNAAQITNLYGPTEACINALFWTAKDKTEIVPIGRPVSNMQAYILDEHLQPVPLGVAGELHLGGAGLARGYLNRPQLTKEKFIPNPYGPKGHPGRLYKTGDLCRYLPESCGAGSGNTSCPLGIEFLGRIDNQVKLRGFRIELGEIEAVLSQHPAIRETVVIVREVKANDSLHPVDKRLIAYIITASSKMVEDGIVIEDGIVANESAPAYTGGKGEKFEMLRAFLSDKLPDYMIPNAFVELDSMPLTPNGKINRRALPAPTRVQRQTAVALPRNETERQLAAIWQEVLSIDASAVGIHDNFFELGGHSLLMIQVHWRLKERLGQELPIVDLFQYPTIDALARHLTRLSGSTAPVLPKTRPHAQPPTVESRRASRAKRERQRARREKSKKSRKR